MPTEDEARRRRRQVEQRLGPRYGELSPADLVHGAEEGGDGFGHALLLGTYSAKGLLRALQHYGVTSLVEARGYVDLAIELDTSDPFVHVARLRDGAGSRLVELRVRLSHGKDAGAGGRLADLTFLDVAWLAAEDPRRGFTRERPPLPGQRFPGLGIGPELEELMALMSRRLGAAGVLGHPQWFHNAALYHPRWIFADAEEEGRFAAMVRDLSLRSLPRTSWAVSLGCVLDGEGRTVEWRPGVQVLPRTPPARRHFGSPLWRAARFAAKAAASYRIDDAKLDALLREKGVEAP